MTSSFGELDLLRFVFELNHQPVDTSRLNQMIFDHQMRNQMQYSALTPPPEVITHQPPSPIPSSFKPKTTNASTPSASTSIAIPEPKVIFNYVPSMPTPAATPEPQSEDKDKNKLEKLSHSEKITDWHGNSIYHNIPDVSMVEFDKMLRESHMMKVSVINDLHNEMPINYDYNPNKSRIRTNYCDPSIAEGRTKNNIASRRSRQRKKFFHHVMQYSVEFDEDENYLMQKQEKWLRGIIENLEEKIVGKSGSEGIDEIKKLRSQCGLK